MSLYSVDPTGQLTLLAQTTSAADGSYGFQVVPPAGSVFMISADGGTYQDEATTSSMNLQTPMRAIDVWNGPTQVESPTVYTEVAVRAIEAEPTPDWSAAGVQASNGLIAGRLGVTTVADFRPITLTSPTAVSSANPQDLTMSLFVSMASTYSSLVDSNPATSLASGIQSLTDLLLSDGDDDTEDEE